MPHHVFFCHHQGSSIGKVSSHFLREAICGDDALKSYLGPRATVAGIRVKMHVLYIHIRGAIHGSGNGFICFFGTAYITSRFCFI